MCCLQLDFTKRGRKSMGASLVVWKILRLEIQQNKHKKSGLSRFFYELD